MAESWRFFPPFTYTTNLLIGAEQPIIFLSMRVDSDWCLVANEIPFSGGKTEQRSKKAPRIIFSLVELHLFRPMTARWVDLEPGSLVDDVTPV